MSEKYIRQNKTSYSIVKNSRTLAKTSNLEDAIFIRDLLIDSSWDLTNIPRIIEKDDKKLRKIGICVLSVFLMMLVLGTVRYFKSERSENDILMAYASGPQKTYYEDPSDTEAGYSENVEYLRKSVEAAAENEAKLIAYAEEAFIVNKAESENLVSKAEELAKEYNIYILLCLDIDDDENCYNKALLIDKSGKILSDYIKTNLIPVVEDDYTEGDGEIPCNEIEIDGQKINVSYTICYDATFSDYLMSMDDKTDLFINPSWDWDEIDDLNYRMQGMSAVMAGVELFKHNGKLREHAVKPVSVFAAAAAPPLRAAHRNSVRRGHKNLLYPGIGIVLFRPGDPRPHGIADDRVFHKEGIAACTADTLSFSRKICNFCDNDLVLIHKSPVLRRFESKKRLKPSQSSEPAFSSACEKLQFAR